LSFPPVETELLKRPRIAFGDVVKTVFILRYLEDEDYRRRINAQLNKEEALHALRGFLFFGDTGTVRRKQEVEQNNQAICLNLLTNAVAGLVRLLHLRQHLLKNERVGYKKSRQQTEKKQQSLGTCHIAHASTGPW